MPDVSGNSSNALDHDHWAQADQGAKQRPVRLIDVDGLFDPICKMRKQNVHGDTIRSLVREAFRAAGLRTSSVLSKAVRHGPKLCRTQMLQALSSVAIGRRLNGQGRPCSASFRDDDPLLQRCVDRIAGFQ